MAIIIVAKRHGFRRCGIAHSSEPTPYRDDRFTAAQLQALVNDSQLVVSYVDADLDDEKDLLNGLASNPSLKEATITSEGALPGLGQTDPAAVGNAGPKLQDGACIGPYLSQVDGVVSPDAGKSESDLEVLWAAAILEDTEWEAAKLKAETETLWDEALAEDVLREAAKVNAVKAAAGAVKAVARAKKAMDK
ncbi:hypothetical protein HZF02_02715 [Pseudomonas yamanorum]|nr:hypothetical protein HZF02_02715 [Pseudomonas yamanorum]